MEVVNSCRILTNCRLSSLSLSKASSEVCSDSSVCQSPASGDSGERCWADFRRFFCPSISSSKAPCLATSSSTRLFEPSESIGFLASRRLKNELELRSEAKLTILAFSLASSAEHSACSFSSSASLAAIRPVSVSILLLTSVIFSLISAISRQSKRAGPGSTEARSALVASQSNPMGASLRPSFLRSRRAELSCFSPSCRESNHQARQRTSAIPSCSGK